MFHNPIALHIILDTFAVVQTLMYCNAVYIYIYNACTQYMYFLYIFFVYIKYIFIALLKIGGF